MDKARKLAPMLSAAAVVLSLGFVGLELRQNTAMMRGSTLQSISDAQFEFMTSIATDPVLSEIMTRVHDDVPTESFSTAENGQINPLFIAFVQSLENAYLQHREGLLPDVVFESYGWRYGLLRTVRFKEFWEELAPNVVSPEFAAFFESRVQIGPAAP